MTTIQNAIADHSRAHRALRVARQARSAEARRLRATGMPWKAVAAALGAASLFTARTWAMRHL